MKLGGDVSCRRRRRRRQEQEQEQQRKQKQHEQHHKQQQPRIFSPDPLFVRFWICLVVIIGLLFHRHPHAWDRRVRHPEYEEDTEWQPRPNNLWRWNDSPPPPPPKKASLNNLTTTTTRPSTRLFQWLFQPPLPVVMGGGMFVLGWSSSTTTTTTIVARRQIAMWTGRRCGSCIHGTTLTTSSFLSSSSSSFSSSSFANRVCVVESLEFGPESRALAHQLELPLWTTEQQQPNEVVDSSNPKHQDSAKTRTISSSSSWEFALTLEPIPFPTTATAKRFEWQEENNQEQQQRQESKRTYALSIQMLEGGRRDDDDHFVMDDGEQPRRGKRKKKKKQQQQEQLPFCVDYCPSSTCLLTRRSSSSSTRTTTTTDLLVKAVGPRKGMFSSLLPKQSPVQQKGQEKEDTHEDGDSGGGAIVYDLTAGFGHDAWILARGGAAQVVMFERNPIVAALVHDALRRLAMQAASITATATIGGDVAAAQRLCQQLSLRIEDGRNLIQWQVASSSRTRETTTTPVLQKHCDIVYLDPMFPPRTKSAMVKKKMRILQRLLESQPSRTANDNDDDDMSQEEKEEDEEASLLDCACQIARHKVVVKRPLHAPPIGGDRHGRNKDPQQDVGVVGRRRQLRQPSYVIKGSTNRWDVYVLPHQEPFNATQQ